MHKQIQLFLKISIPLKEIILVGKKPDIPKILSLDFGSKISIRSKTLHSVPTNYHVAMLL